MRWIALWLGMANALAADPAVVSAVNAERRAAGRSDIIYDTTLEAVARGHGLDMARNGFFSHAGSDGSDLGDRLGRAGFRYCFAAENIAKGQRSLEEVMRGWMASQGHKRNVLHRKAEAFGLARTDDNIWVMVLAAAC